MDSATAGRSTSKGGGRKKKAGPFLLVRSGDHLSVSDWNSQVVATSSSAVQA